MAPTFYFKTKNPDTYIMERIQQQRQFIMSTNGIPERPKWQLPVREIMISVASTLIVGYGAILWRINETTTKIQEQQIEDIKYREEDRAGKNQMQLDIRDVRERIIKLETNTQKTPL